MASRDQRFFSIDLLRVIAAITVFLMHVWQMMDLMPTDSIDSVGGAVFLLKAPA